MNDSLSTPVHAFAIRVLMSVLVDETLIPWLVNLSTSFRKLPFSLEISPPKEMEIYPDSYSFQTM